MDPYKTSTKNPAATTKPREQSGCEFCLREESQVTGIYVLALVCLPFLLIASSINAPNLGNPLGCTERT